MRLLRGARKTFDLVMTEDIPVTEACRAGVGIVEVLLLLLSREVSKQSEGHNK